MNGPWKKLCRWQWNSGCGDCRSTAVGAVVTKQGFLKNVDTPPGVHFQKLDGKTAKSFDALQSHQIIIDTSFESVN